MVEHYTNDIVITETGLPPKFDLNSVQLNIKALRRGVMGWGGFEGLSLSGYYGEADVHNYAVLEAEQPGSDIAYHIGPLVRAETSRRSMFIEPEADKLGIRNSTLHLEWNGTALNSRLPADNRDDPVPAMRTQQLNTAIKIEAIKGVLAYNIPRAFLNAPKNNAAVDIMCWFLASNAAVTQNYGMAAGLIGARSLVAAPLLRRHKAKRYDQDPRDIISDPLFLMARPTRAVIGVGVLASSRLVRAA
jgi:hypothetical protein